MGNKICLVYENFSVKFNQEIRIGLVCRFAVAGGIVITHCMDDRTELTKRVKADKRLLLGLKSGNVYSVVVDSPRN